MPRDGSGIYSSPVGTHGIPNTTVASTPYNTWVDDVAQDLNTPRPIVAGGTGASTPAGALANLGGEHAGQLVTNYNSFTFASGSFYSTGSATGAPVAGQDFTGFASVYGVGEVVLQAHDLIDADPGSIYVRRQHGGTWGAWTRSDNTGKVSKAGDTMTGNLIIAAATPTLTLQKTALTGQTDRIYGYTGGSPRWALDLGDTSPESSGNVGSNVSLTAFSDTGAIIGPGLTIMRSNLATTVYGVFNAIGAVLNLQDKSGTGQPVMAFQNASTTLCQLWYFPTDATFRMRNQAGGPQYDLMIDSQGITSLGIGFWGRTGKTGAYSTSALHNFNYNAGNVECWVNASNFGNISLVSDYRIKKDVADLPGMWTTVKQLRPIRYTQAEYDPPSAAVAPSSYYQPEGYIPPPAPGPMFPADDVERWGFIAHELQQTLIESAATGIKDDPVHIQSPNPWTVIAALTCALQEAMARIEALEAR
jgi:hypothetical protein